MSNDPFIWLFKWLYGVQQAIIRRNTLKAARAWQRIYGLFKSGTTSSDMDDMEKYETLKRFLKGSFFLCPSDMDNTC